MSETSPLLKTHVSGWQHNVGFMRYESPTTETSSFLTCSDNKDNPQHFSRRQQIEKPSNFSILFAFSRFNKRSVIKRISLHAFAGLNFSYQAEFWQRMATNGFLLLHNFHNFPIADTIPEEGARRDACIF